MFIDGISARSDNQIVDTDLQEIVVNRKRVTGHGSRYYLLHKPRGVVTARSDREHKTVIDLIAPEDQVDGLYPIGRLDRDTKGLLLITDNGPLGYRMLHPSHHVYKTYLVEVNGLLDEQAVQAFAEGVVFHDGTQCKPAKLDILEAGVSRSQARVTLSEGKFHQIKKMFLCVGVKVTSLTRVSFGGFELPDDLPEGQYRELNEQEKAILKQYLD